MIASSVLDYKWMEDLKKRSTGPFLFLAEGLFMYLEKSDVKNLVIKMQSEFPGSELACEVVNESIISGPLKGAMKMQDAEAITPGQRGDLQLRRQRRP